MASKIDIDKINADGIIDTEEAMGTIEDPKPIQGKDTSDTIEFWKEKALFDPLTELPNRFASDLIIDKLKDECKYLAVVDIDHFKEVNDTYGHAAGDLALQTLAKFLDDKLIATRFGGEEFVCYLVGDEFNTEESTKAYLNDMLKQIEAINFGEIDKSITVSIGVVGFDKDTDIENLFKSADKALYCAKDWGRNQVVFYEEGMDCEAHSVNDKDIIKNENCDKKQETRSITMDRVRGLVERINALNEDELQILKSNLKEERITTDVWHEDAHEIVKRFNATQVDDIKVNLGGIWDTLDHVSSLEVVEINRGIGFEYAIKAENNEVIFIYFAPFRDEQTKGVDFKDNYFMFYSNGGIVIRK